MTQINSYAQNNNSVFTNNFAPDNHKFIEIKYNSNSKEQPNPISSPIFSDNYNNFNKEIPSKNIIKNGIGLKGGGISNNTNFDINASSTLEIIEYPISEKPKNIKNNDSKDSDKYKFDNNNDLQHYKMPIDIKGDSDDDIYLNDEDFEKISNKEKSKKSFQNTNTYYQNWSKPSSVANSEIFLDYNNQKKIVVILNNTKKYHQELKHKINNFKKLIYPTKDKRSDNCQEFPDKKSKQENNYKYSTNAKDNKNEKNIFGNDSNKKDMHLKSYKKENVAIDRNINYGINKVKDNSIIETKGNDKYLNCINISNNSTIKRKDLNTNLFTKKSFKSRIDKNIKNNLKKEITENDKIVSKRNYLNISSLIRNDSKDKNIINNIKNSYYLISKTNRSISTDKSKVEKNNKSKQKSICHPNNRSKKKNNMDKNDENNDSLKIKNENKTNNKKNIFDINHIIPYNNQNSNIYKKIEKNKIKKIYISNNKTENNNPFKENSNKKEILSYINNCNKGNDYKMAKKNIVIHSPSKKYMCFSLESIKE